MPAWDLLPNRRHWSIGRPHGGAFDPQIDLRYGSMMTSLGCPFHCVYCHIAGEQEGSASGPIGRYRHNTDPIGVIRTNFLDACPLVELCAAQRKWLISFSTSEVYGRTVASYLPGNRYDDPDLYELSEDETPMIMGPTSNQRWAYACAKQLLERFIYAHHHEHGMPFTIVRPLNFFGPRMDYLPGRDGEGVPRVLACFMTALIKGRPLQLVDGGWRQRTIVSIHEAIGALLLMLAKPEKAQNRFFNIGNRDNEVTAAELADLMRCCYAEITGDPTCRHHPIEAIDSKQFYGEGYEDCDRRMPKLDHARTLLGWTPRIPLREILMETMTYYHEQYVESRTRGSSRSEPAATPGRRPSPGPRRSRSTRSQG